MADEIITALSRCSGLFVIARNSPFTYRGKAVDVRQVGRELRAFLSWVTESKSAGFSPDKAREQLEGRLPRPVEDHTAWAADQDDLGAQD